MAIVWARKDLDPYERLVMLSLADHADDEGYCFPSIRRLCDRTGMKERGLQGVLKRLTNRGDIRIEIGGGRSGTNRYQIVNNPAPGAPPHDTHPRTGRTTPPHPITENPAPGAPKPSRTTSEPSEDIRAILCTVLSEGAADDFIQHRKSKKAKLTPRAAELIVGKLADCADPDEEIRRSVMNGWTGVFPSRKPITQTQVSDEIWKSVAEGTARQ